MKNTHFSNGKAITGHFFGSPYYFGTVQDLQRAMVIVDECGADRQSFHGKLTDVGVQWGIADRIYEDDWTLEALTARHRALARYSIYRHGIAPDGYNRMNEELPQHRGLIYDEAKSICDNLNAESRVAAGNPASSWCLTMYFMKIERPVPPLLRPGEPISDIGQSFAVPDVASCDLGCA